MAANGRALIVYETMFGNTERIAQAIRDGVAESMPAEAVPVNRAPDVVPDDVQLLIVGGPTHAFSMSRPSTRADARKQGEVTMPVEVGIREWLAALERAGAGRRIDGVRVATFDTRITKVRRLPGSAARAAAKQLRRMGYRTLTRPESFYLDESTGPIADPEIDRARRWAKQLAHLCTQPA